MSLGEPVLKISRVWAMPDKNTFKIKPIGELVDRYCRESRKLPNSFIVDPFANSNTYADYRNDLDPQYNTDTHMDGLEFLKTIKSNSVTLVLWDPPFSPTQSKEVYTHFEKSVNWSTTTADYWSKQKDEIARILVDNGRVITCGWHTNGVGMSRHFHMEELLIVPHGGTKNDTLVTVERKVPTLI